MTYTFAKHETFQLREGWLFKGMSAIKRAEAEGELPTIFMDKDAPERLGIGRNMVRSLRYWMQATGVAEEIYEGRLLQRLTPFGELLWEFDPYLELDGSLWLIHYHLVCNDSLASSWYWFFNHYARPAFTDDQALDALEQWVVTAVPDRQVAKSSLKKDMACLLRTYLPDQRSKSPEYLRQSPLAQLGILDQFGDGAQKRYHLKRLEGARLHPLIALYVMLDRQNIHREGIAEVRLGQLLQEPKNVGRVFNITSAGLTDIVTVLNSRYPDMGIRFIRTAGLDQLTLPEVSPANVLQEYFEDTASLSDL